MKVVLLQLVVGRHSHLANKLIHISLKFIHHHDIILHFLERRTNKLLFLKLRIIDQFLVSAQVEVEISRLRVLPLHLQFALDEVLEQEDHLFDLDIAGC